MSVDTAFINSQINILQTAESAGARFKKSGKDYHSHCPIHGGDNPGAFVVFGDQKSWKCFTRAECNQYGHDGIALLRALNGWTFSEVAEKYTTPIDPKEAARRAAEAAKRAERDLQEKIEQAQKALEELRKARKWIEYHDSMDDHARQLWRGRGIPDEWQDFWKFGYTDSCPVYRTSASLTMPILLPDDLEPRNIRHRLLSPENSKDKYRPERAGLPALPFYADTTLPLEAADRIIVVEGEIKAAVTMVALDRPLWQVVGVPGKEAFETIAGTLKNHDGVWVIPDPDGLEAWREKTHSVSGRLITLTEKIDDLINNGMLDKQDLCGLMDQARKA